MSASAAEPEVLARPDAFRTLVNPDCSHCIDEAKARAGELRDDDPVLAWTRGKYDGGAIPIRFFLNPYRVISDTYGVFVFDPDAGFARGYEPSLDFTFHGWRKGIVVMRHKDGTLFSALSGQAFAGPRQGERLKPVATLTTQWGPWNKAYPGSVAYRMFEKYQPTELPRDTGAESLGTRGPADPRLPSQADVLGVTVGDQHKAYPLASLPESGGVLCDTLGGQQILVFWQPVTRTAAAYLPVLENRESPNLELAFDATLAEAPFVDRASGSRFGIEGRAVSGSLQGQALRWLDGVQCRWFAWAAEFPQTQIAGQPAARPAGANRPGRGVRPDDSPQELVLVRPDAVLPDHLELWRAQGFSGVVTLLEEGYAPDVYRSASMAAERAGFPLYYWLEVARQPTLADRQPQWMASLGMHDDWQARFPRVAPPKQGEVAKAYPWVPIAYTQAFEAHLERIARLLAKVPSTYQGLLLNDLQGGPAACGCGNLRCRWAIDYGVPATASVGGVDDAAALFVTRVGKLAPGKQIVPVWMTECEERDLSSDKAPGGRSTGQCGSVPCARGTCPIAFRKQWKALVGSHSGPLGLLILDDPSRRDTHVSGAPRDEIAESVAYLDATPLAAGAVPRDRLWLVIQGTALSDDREAAARAAARQARPGAVVVDRMLLDQSYEPRVVSVP